MDTELFGMMFEMQMIVDQFRDEWHKHIMDMFVGQGLRYHLEIIETNKSSLN